MSLENGDLDIFLTRTYFSQFKLFWNFIQYIFHFCINLVATLTEMNFWKRNVINLRENKKSREKFCSTLYIRFITSLCDQFKRNQ